MRGAPAIAIVGCLSLAVEIFNEQFTDKKSLRQEIEGKLNYLVSARPTAVNVSFDMMRRETIVFFRCQVKNSFLSNRMKNFTLHCISMFVLFPDENCGG